MTEANHDRSRLGRILCALGKLPASLALHFREESRSTLFSAALAVIAVHVGALSILIKLSLMIVANLASQGMPALNGAGPVVLLMDETHWQERYFEHSPLDRCTMAEDLAAILAHAPRTVAVDFDLSPSLRPADAACQATLDTFLDRNAARVVLLSPIKVGTQRVIEQKRDWMLARCKAGGVFADGGLELSLGMVIDSLPSHDRMAEVVRQRSGSTICASMASTAGVTKWLMRRDDDFASADASGHSEPVAINFAHFKNLVHNVGIGQLDSSGITDWPQRDVFFGGDYGSAKEDRFGTPIGPLPGIAVHAARRVSLDHPVAELQPVAGFAADIMIAFVFSLGIAVFWSSYASFRISPNPSERQLASVMVAGFVCFYAVLVLLFFQLGTDLFAVGILIAPLVIAISMLVDGFITGPIAAILKLVRHEAEEPAERGKFIALIGVVAALALLQAVAHIRPLALASIPVVIVAALLDRAAVRIVANLSAPGRLHAVTPWRGGVQLSLIVIAGFGLTGWLLRSGAVAFSSMHTQGFFTTLACIAVALALGMAYPLGAPAAPAAPVAERRRLPSGESDAAATSLPGPLIATSAVIVSTLKKLIFWGAVFTALAFLSH